MAATEHRGREDMETADLLGTDEALQYLGISRATLYKLVGRYSVPRYSVPLKGKRVFYKRADLDRLREPFKRAETARPAE